MHHSHVVRAWAPWNCVRARRNRGVWCRRLSKQRFRRSLLSDLSAKLSDLNKLATVIKITKPGVVFRAPSPILWKLLHSLTTLSRVTAHSLASQHAAYVTALTSLLPWIELALQPDSDFAASPLTADDSRCAVSVVKACFTTLQSHHRQPRVTTTLPTTSPAATPVVRTLTSNDLFSYSRVITSALTVGGKLQPYCPPPVTLSLIRTAVIGLLCHVPLTAVRKDMLSCDPSPTNVKLAQSLLHTALALVQAEAAANARLAIQFVQDILTIPGLGYATLKFAGATASVPDTLSPDKPYHAVVLLPALWESLVTVFSQWKNKNRVPVLEACGSSRHDSTTSTSSQELHWHVGCWLLGNMLSLCPPLSYLTSAGIGATVDVYADLLALLPLECFVQPVPILHMSRGASVIVQEMPRILVLQVPLRTVCLHGHCRVARAMSAFGLCVRGVCSWRN